MPTPGAMATPLRALLFLGAGVTRTAAHGMMSFPPPRNALDRRFAPWNGTVPPFPIAFDHPNYCALPDAASADPRKISGGGGQACFWVRIFLSPPPPLSQPPS